MKNPRMISIASFHFKLQNKRIFSQTSSRKCQTRLIVSGGICGFPRDVDISGCVLRIYSDIRLQLLFTSADRRGRTTSSNTKHHRLLVDVNSVITVHLICSQSEPVGMELAICFSRVNSRRSWPY